MTHFLLPAKQPFPRLSTKAFPAIILGMMLNLMPSANAQHLDQGNISISPSEPIANWRAPRDLYPDESVALQVNVTRSGSVGGKEYTLEKGNPKINLNKPQSLWTTIQGKDGETLFMFEILNSGEASKPHSVEVNAKWITKGNGPIAGGGGGGDGGGSDDSIYGSATGDAYNDIPIFTWHYESRLEFADSQSQIHFHASADANGATINLNNYTIQGEANWNIATQVNQPNVISGSVDTDSPGKGKLKVTFNGNDIDESDDEIAFGKVDLAIASSGSAANLKEDRLSGGGVAPAPHEMDPGGIVIAPIKNSNGDEITPSKRIKLTLTGNGSALAGGNYILGADANLTKLKFFTVAVGGNPITINDINKNLKLTSPKTLYIGAEAFEPDSQIQTGILTLTYKLPLLTGGNTYEIKDELKVTLVAMDIKGHRRGTLNKPDDLSPDGIYGRETVLLENADRDEGSATKRDLDTATVDTEKDDDFVKIVLTFPKNFKPSGIGLRLKHEGMKVNGEKKTFDSAVVREGGSHLNFYDDQGTKLTDADLKIEDLANPGSGYLAKLLTDGTLTLFIEGADDFGAVGQDDTSQANAKLMGGALLTLEMTGTDATSGPRLLVFRGGFFRYTHKRNKPGDDGILEFFDGKGRITNTTMDLGNSIRKWTAKSGLPGGANYDVNRGNGHTPPGWWLLYKRDAFDEASQKNQEQGIGEKLVVQQGSYCRWYQDDFAPHYTAFTENTGKRKYLYQEQFEVDRNIGKPAMPELTSPDGQTIMFKFQMSVIPPTSPSNRTQIQIHPDGWKNGTSGCIGIQSYDHCKEAYRYLNDYRGMKIKVELN